MVKKKDSSGNRGRVSWYNIDNWLLNGFILPASAYTTLCELVNAGRFHDLDSAIREGIRTIIEENTSQLIRQDRGQMRRLMRINQDLENAAQAKPDNHGMGNMRHLNRMYQAMQR
jgi:Arc/MetJ-type ribon-helix-helix transcriptional regulator